MTALISFLITAVTGVIIFLFLPPSEGQRGIHNTLFGYGRHDWGAFHDWAGIVLLIAIIIHIALHLDWFISTTKNVFSLNKSDNNKL